MSVRCVFRSLKNCRAYSWIVSPYRDGEQRRIVSIHANVLFFLTLSIPYPKTQRHSRSSCFRPPCQSFRTKCARRFSGTWFGCSPRSCAPVVNVALTAARAIRVDRSSIRHKWSMPRWCSLALCRWAWITAVRTIHIRESMFEWLTIWNGYWIIWTIDMMRNVYTRFSNINNCQSTYTAT